MVNPMQIHTHKQLQLGLALCNAHFALDNSFGSPCFLPHQFRRVLKLSLMGWRKTLPKTWATYEARRSLEYICVSGDQIVIGVMRLGRIPILDATRIQLIRVLKPEFASSTFKLSRTVVSAFCANPHSSLPKDAWRCL